MHHTWKWLLMKQKEVTYNPNGADLYDAMSSDDPVRQSEAALRAYQQAKDIVQNVEATTSERQICLGLLFGLSAKEIARMRNCSNRTVENHIANIKRKYNIRNITPLILGNIIASFHHYDELLHFVKNPMFQRIIRHLVSQNNEEYSALYLSFVRENLGTWFQDEAAQFGVSLSLKEAQEHLW